ncbi:hypothetical protein MYSI104531_27300 [Mycobacterium simiae]
MPGGLRIPRVIHQLLAYPGCPVQARITTTAVTTTFDPHLHIAPVGRIRQVAKVFGQGTHVGRGVAQAALPGVEVHGQIRPVTGLDLRPERRSPPHPGNVFGVSVRRKPKHASHSGRQVELMEMSHRVFVLEMGMSHHLHLHA